MGQSAIDAIVLAVNVTIFIIALTISINLMSSVMQMSEIANDIIQGENGTLIESSENKERIFSGIDLINYSKDSDTKAKYFLYVENTSKTLESYLSSANLKEVIKKEYTMEYVGVLSNKSKFVFKEKTI